MLYTINSRKIDSSRLIWYGATKFPTCLVLPALDLVLWYSFVPAFSNFSAVKGHVSPAAGIDRRPGFRNTPVLRGLIEEKEN